MATQETFLTPFVESMQTTAERFIQIAQFDKTVEGTIISKDNEDSHHYFVSISGCPRLSVYTLENDNTYYTKGDSVYISLPNGDYSGDSKYIIGKVNKVDYEATILLNIEDIIAVQNNLSKNVDKIDTLIIEFTPIVNGKPGIGIQETVFPFTISAKQYQNNEDINFPNYWSTSQLYGNIFNNDIPCPQRIIIKNLENYVNINFSWTKTKAYDIPILTFKNKETGEKASVELTNINYYTGYSKNFLDSRAKSGIAVLLTESGPKIFQKQENVWQYLGEAKPDILDYTWREEWYTYDITQEEAATTYVPPYYRLLAKRPIDYHNKLYCLVGIKSDAQVESSYSRLVIYDILE